MFGKLIKYEIKAAGKWYLLLYLATLIISPIFGFVTRAWLDNTLEYSESIFSLQDHLYFLALLTIIALTIGLGLATLFLVINRFYKNIYGREGYLTLTLPVSNHQIILSKLTAAFFWMTASSATVVLAFFFFIAPLIDLPNLLVLLPNLLTQLSQYVSIPLLLLVVIVSQLASILLIYLAISIGQLFQNRRGLMSVVAYFALYILISFLSSFILPELNSDTGLLFDNSYLIFVLLTSAVQGVGCYLATNYIMTHRLNLQ